jgi:branched-chain amino acid transport system permease protein
MEFFLIYQPVIDTICVAIGIALSQYIALRAGLFALATAGFASIGAYAAAIVLKRADVAPWIAVLLGTSCGLVAGLILALPLARVKGHFQAIATLAFVEIVRTLALYAEPLTGGARGINAIPKVVSTGHLVAALAVVMVLLIVVNRTGIGRAFDAIRQDETVAKSLGISISRFHALAFGLSAAIAGLFGSLLALNTYSIAPEEFGFSLVVAAIGAVILGGRTSVLGPAVGATILVVLPELARPLADYRFLLHGALLIVAITYLPQGIVDVLIAQWKRLRANAPAVAVANPHG